MTPGRKGQRDHKVRRVIKEIQVHRDRKAIQARPAPPAQLGLKDQLAHKVRKERQVRPEQLAPLGRRVR